VDEISRIDQILKKRGISGYKMTKDLGLSSGIYSQWVTKKTKPSLRTLRMIAEYLDVSVEYLLTGEEKEKTPAQTSESLSGLDQELIRVILSLSDAEKASLYAFLSTHKREE
jgi:transcriptional regulator with XRE-family HTH domain